MAFAAIRKIYTKASRYVMEGVANIWACRGAAPYHGRAKQAALQEQSMKRDSRGHLCIKTKLVSNSAVFCYALKVFLFFPQELYAIDEKPQRYIWQTVRNRRPEESGRLDIAHALHMRKRIREAASTLIQAAETMPADQAVTPPAFESAFQYLNAEAHRICQEGYAPGASEADEFILIEMEQALMRTFDATQDQQLLASLDGLMKYHSARHYFATLPVVEREGQEAFANRMKELKRFVRGHITITHHAKAASFLLTDLFGACIAGLAMAWAILGLYVAWRLMGSPKTGGFTMNFAGPVIAMTIVAYMIKDRLKVWGQRYFGYIAEYCGIFIPTLNSNLLTSSGLKVGMCGAVCDIVDSKSLARKIVQARSNVMPQSTELVMRYSKITTLDSSAFCARSSSCALVDIMNIDLSFISRRMHPKIDKYWVVDSCAGTVCRVAYPRVYKVPIVVEWGMKGTSNIFCCLGVVDRDGLARIESYHM